VDDCEFLAITAIKDIEQEGAIASSLIRSGWKVVYRETSPDLLRENLLRFSGAVLLLSDDFIAAEKLEFENTILLRGRSHPLGKVGISAPQSDFELGELLRNHSLEDAVEKIQIPATQSKVVAFGSAQGGVGTTTLALNAAEQISLLGKNVLLVDANVISPAIAEHCEIHDIRSQAREFAPNLSLFELTELAQLIHLAAIADVFDFIIIDYGLISEPLINGARIADRTFQWILHSQGRLILTTGSYQKSIDKTGRVVKRLRERAPTLPLDIAITLDRGMSRRDRIQLEIRTSESFSTRVVTVSRDNKAVAAALERGSTLQMCAPRSAINREIAQYIKEGQIQE
jgi:cellulose biosynthesis protein BcsQ